MEEDCEHAYLLVTSTVLAVRYDNAQIHGFLVLSYPTTDSMRIAGA